MTTRTIPALAGRGWGLVLVALALVAWPGAGCDSATGDDAGDALAGVWRRQEDGQTNKGKEYLAGGAGFLGNFTAGSFTRATPFTWALEGDWLTEDREDGQRYRVEILEISAERLTTKGEDGRTAEWSKVDGVASPAP